MYIFKKGDKVKLIPDIEYASLAHRLWSISPRTDAAFVVQRVIYIGAKGEVLYLYDNNSMGSEVFIGMSSDFIKA